MTDLEIKKIRLAASKREWRKNNPEKVKLQKKRYALKHRERIKLKASERFKKKYSQMTPEQKQERLAKKNVWRKENPEKRRAQEARSRAKNPPKRHSREYFRSYYAKNKDKYKVTRGKYLTKNPHRGAVQSVKRRAIKKKATLKSQAGEPLFLKEIEIFYEKSKVIQGRLDFKVDVDHIVPLVGKDWRDGEYVHVICGLHVPWNLQLLCKQDNRSKADLFDGTYENESWKNRVVGSVNSDLILKIDSES